MNYKKTKCEVCKEDFKDKDDIVVCPKCGAPYHRECYKSVGYCKFEEENGEGAEYNSNDLDNDLEIEIETEKNSKKELCPICQEGYIDNITSKCPKCGFSYSEDEEKEIYSMLKKMFMGGFENNEEIEEGVYADEIEKFVGVNSRYYMTSFKKIKETGKSNFNISAFLFSGAWMLYRKQYKLGIITLLIIMLLKFLTQFSLIFLTYDVLKNIAITMSGNANFSNLSDILYIIFSNSQQSSEVFRSLPILDKLFVILPFLFNILSWITMIICGLKANKAYMNFCCKKISSIKKSHKNSYKDKIEDKIIESGGVNVPLGICLFVCYIIINEFPKFI